MKLVELKINYLFNAKKQTNSVKFVLNYRQMAKN